MTKTELMETYAAEQLAEMVVELNEKDEQSKKIYDALQEDYKKIYKEYKKMKKESNSDLKENNFLYEINSLQSKVEKYRKAFEDAKKERDCQIAEYQKKIEELEEYADSLKCGIERKQCAINQIDGIICELFGVSHNGDTYSEGFKELLREKSAVGKTISDFLPTEPIKVADMLINASKKRTNCMTGKEYDKYIFEKWQLKQIAEHLLIYCNHNGEAEE